MSKFQRLFDYEPFTIDTEEELWRFACCDCGLVHDFVMRIDKRNKERVIIYLVQKPRSTGQLRRNEYGNLHNGGNPWKLIRNESSEAPRT